MKQHLSTIALICVFFVGLSVLLYPSVSEWWNARVQTRAVADYSAALETLPQEDYSAYFDAADAYNQTLVNGRERFLLTEEERETYQSILDLGNGIMGYIEIDKIGVTLPIYHGTSEAVLQVAVGHLEGSSLPVGGAGTHCVMSGHRGLPSARLFTDLVDLVIGDTFVITVLDRQLTYEVDQIRIVEPYEMDDLALEPGQDYCTLVTCTPYGINSHRYLVRGHRIENVVERPQIVVQPDASQMDTMLVASVIGAVILLGLLVVMLITTGKKKGR